MTPFPAIELEVRWQSVDQLRKRPISSSSQPPIGDYIFTAHNQGRHLVERTLLTALLFALVEILTCVLCWKKQRKFILPARSPAVCHPSVHIYWAAILFGRLYPACLLQLFSFLLLQLCLNSVCWRLGCFCEIVMFAACGSLAV